MNLLKTPIRVDDELTIESIEFIDDVDYDGLRPKRRL